jgi:hypothetical protein
MRTSRQPWKFKRIACSLAVGLLLAGLLGGCTEPFVNVVVQVDTTCQAGGMGRPIGEPPGPGACILTPVLTAPTDPNLFNTGYFNTATKTILSDHNHRCNAGGTNKMCQSSPGSTMCGGINKICKTRFTPTSGNNGNCTCGCPN